ncbi:metallophosphoesterase-like protein [Xylariaceae sp. FL0804]|nr:metallophosphoesterase-like protein [Xylariaceae sp. FL0804]
MKLYAIGDIHLAHPLNREALGELEPHPEDGLILCGDVGESRAHLELAFRTATANFREVFWCPGNHELYTLPPAEEPRGERKYELCVRVARQFGVHTPEDDFFRWEGEGGPALIAPVFTLYDYSFRPADVSRADALRWAEEKDTVATDEFTLHPDPHATRDDWCRALVARTEARLEAATRASPGTPVVIANHWPLREDLVYIPWVPRFSLWCGTTLTRDWHTRFAAKVVVTGHLHVRRTDWRDGVRFEECSLGYPRQWEDARKAGKNINDMLREILPGPPAPPPDGGDVPTQWRKLG